MTGKQSAVLWLGLILIVTRLLTTSQWSELWGTLATKTPASNTNSVSPSNSGATAPPLASVD
jgi:hypothetical protein